MQYREGHRPGAAELGGTATAGGGGFGWALTRFGEVLEGNARWALMAAW